MRRQTSLHKVFEEISRLQRFVNLLCCSSAKNAEHVLHRLRSTASAEVIVTEDPNPPATTHRTFAAPFQFFMENEQDPFMATSLEEISALVQWIAQDLDHFVQQRAPPSPPPPTEQSPPDQNGCEIAGLSSTTTAKTGLTVQEFLC
ncbi:uncharacterized protein A1O5_07174 [Cladophialophora psammophila CBS 110553]|uniref:Uncharacterized protein n=1 Tax=Cladophialophora psammophila CBS 110553 TaxID=1182543 RepID=W9WZJ3_9EURO|nr:uncharacterized protein A1O5_07174 [Cladophialophora psammophila CBS 110553]EXJ70101.1 hypothetical protein A1O5_07174 [Cladophialophora psammophila CBS 110553]